MLSINEKSPPAQNREIKMSDKNQVNPDSTEVSEKNKQEQDSTPCRSSVDLAGNPTTTYPDIEDEDSENNSGGDEG